ncbi:hypothetical protein D3C81_1738330 [compost metagenome]
MKPGIAEHAGEPTGGEGGAGFDHFGALRLFLEQEVADKVVGQIQGDPVHHNAGDNLVDAAGGLQPAHNGAPEAAAQHPHDNGQGSVDIGRQVQHNADPDGAQHTHGDLAFGADVEQPGPVGKAYGKTA